MEKKIISYINELIYKYLLIFTQNETLNNIYLNNSCRLPG